MHSFPEPIGALAATAEDREPAAPAALCDQEVFSVVVRNMRKFAGPHPEFDDLVQKALLATHRALPSFRGECQETTFLYRICYRVWLEHSRWYSRFTKRVRLTDEGTLPEAVDLRDPGELALHRERYAELYGALDMLPEPMRAVIVLHDLDELELEEIATIVAANQHTVRSRLRHGRKKLRALLQRQALLGGER